MAKGGVVGNLRVNLGLDSAEYQSGLKKAQNDAERFSSAVKIGFAAVAAAAISMGTAFAVGIKNTIDAADKLGDVASMLGVNVEALQELRFAADRSGMGVKNFDVALRRFIRRSSEAAKGTGAAKGAFEELGISLKDNQGQLKDSKDLMAEVADALQKVQDPADKLRLAFKMFDTDGAAMVNVLSGGSEGLASFAQEARELGIVLSEDTVRAAKQVKDNFSVVGYAMQGVTTTLTAALAPALVLVSEGILKLARLFAGFLDYLPAIAEYAAVAGGALALMFGPALLAAVGQLTIAIGVGLVTALKVLKAAILANPLGALAVGIMVAVTAIYHFRDEIQKAIGTDVIAIVKDAANYIIGSFVAAYEDIKFVWNHFGDIMGAAVISGVNLAIEAINGLIQKAAQGLDWFIDKVNIMPGVNIGMIGEAKPLKGLDNPYSDSLGDAVKRRNEATDSALSFDYIGKLGDALTKSTPAVVDFTTALADANNQITNVDTGTSAAGASAAAAGEKMQVALDQLRQSLMTAEEAERNSYATRLLDIQSYYDQGMIIKAEYDEMMARAHQEHTDNMAEITRQGVEEEMRQRQRLVGSVSSVMGSLSSIMESTGQKNLGIAKAFAVTEAIINTAQGVTKALAQGGMFGFAGAAAVAAAGAAQIATIMSANKGSSKRPSVSGSNQEVSAGSNRESSGTENLQIQGINPKDLYTGEVLMDLMGKMVDMQRDGYQLIVVDQ